MGPLTRGGSTVRAGPVWAGAWIAGLRRLVRSFARNYRAKRLKARSIWAYRWRADGVVRLPGLVPLGVESVTIGSRFLK